MLPCEISIQHSRCIQVLLQSASRSRSSDAYADVQMDLGPGASHSLTSNSLPRHSKESLELSPNHWSRTFPRVARGATISPSESHFFWRNDTLVSHWSLANPDFMASISDSDCQLARQCARTSFFLRMATDSRKPLQKHAKVRFSSRSSPETSASSTQRNESARPTECCHVTVLSLRRFPNVVVT